MDRTVVAAHFLTSALLFVYARRRLGAWTALAAAVLLLFLGSAAEVLLWPFAVSIVGSIATGLAALLAIDLRATAGDLAAPLLLALSLHFGGVGVVFLLAAILESSFRARGGDRHGSSRRRRHSTSSGT